MRTDMQGLDSLKNLRQQWQEDAVEEYPKDVLPELLVLYDVCGALDLNIFEAREVLGNAALQAVKEHINSPANIA
ncbi:MAG: hypothetical protein NT075_23710 [Chloroflexi bacterium]|nr:hypothetical protein [Chloroflexota bacterium]